MAFRDLERAHAVTYADIHDEPDWKPVTASEQRIVEFLGSPAQVLSHLDGHEILVVQAAPVTDLVLDSSPSLVCVLRGGPVNVDMRAATARGIPVVTTPGKNAPAVAELTVALMIMLARNIASAATHILNGGDFGRDNYEGRAWFGSELCGKTLGLIGFGQVGRQVAERAKVFGMRILAFDPFVDSRQIVAGGVEPAGFEDLLSTADFISLHARSTRDNDGLLDAAALAAMKPAAFLINTARAELIDEAALAASLADGHLGGAAFDVLSPPPPNGVHPLMRFSNVIVLPHVGGATQETLLRGGEMAVAEIGRHLARDPLLHLANPR